MPWLIDFTPFAVSLFGRWLGIRQDRLVEITTQLEQTIAERTLAITKSNEALMVENAERLRTEKIISRGKREWEANFDSISDLIVVTKEIRFPFILRCNKWRAYRPL